VVNDNEPTELIAGNTWTWTRTFADYPAGTWSLAYHFKCAEGSFGISGAEVVASGTAFSITKAASATATIPPGRYRWQAYVTNGAVRQLADEGWLEVQRDFAASGTFDPRSSARQIVDAITAYLADPDNLNAASYALNGRSLSRWPREQLLNELSRWESRVASEEAAERLRAGLKTRKTVYVRF
jgi:hypothetical protein